MSGRPRPRIVEDRPATGEEWRDIHRACPFATYFEGPEWAAIWQRYTVGRIRPDPRLVTFDDGTRVLAPWSRERRTLGRSVVLAAPGGTYGSWLYPADAGIGPGHAAALFQQLGRAPVVLRQNPFDPVLAELVPPGGWTRSDFTQVLHLEAFADVDRVLRQNQVYRKQRQGEEAGLFLRLSADPADVAHYYEVYQAARERWGGEASNAYGPTLFEAIPLDSPNVDFWLIDRAGEVIGGGPFLKAGHHVASWLTLADPDHFHARPYDFAYARLIHHYRDQGFRYFDFNPSGGHEGVVRFKENFGAARLPSNVRIRRPLRDRLLGDWLQAPDRESRAS